MSAIRPTLDPVRSDPASGRARLGPFSPTGLVIAAATALGLAARGLLLTRHGFLTSGTVEYDDGVYLGAAIRLLQGTLPYRGFAFVQPPGILLVALPFALVARLVSTAAGLAVARVVTVCASAACVPLAGNLVRHRGIAATLVTCGFLAVYPVDVVTARTLLLEPWMNLCCLLAVNAAFRHGRLASTQRLAWAGALLGFAASVKFWAALPAAVLLAWCLFERDSRGRRTGIYLGALAAGFAIPVAPFALSAPVAFFRSTVLDQAARTGATVPLSDRLAYLTGLIDIFNHHGRLDLHLRGGSAFAAASNGTMIALRADWLPYACAGVGVVILAAAYLRRPRSRSQLEWFAIVVAAASCVAITAYSAFFYHYPAFPAPWLAIAFGAAADAAVAAAAGAAAVTAASVRRAAKLTVLAGVAVVILAVAIVQSRQLAGETAPPSPPAVAGIIPAGACLVTDQISFAIAADRFPSSGSGSGCPDVIDSLAVTLVLGDGATVQADAGKMPQLIAGWQSIFGRAHYVWLSSGFQQRIPWTPDLRAWFVARFRLVRTFRDYGDSRLYVRES
jgi:hypothetical protein